jgi:polyhydroxyalkanoate synthesis repressor PhaR
MLCRPAGRVKRQIAAIAKTSIRAIPAACGARPGDAGRLECCGRKIGGRAEGGPLGGEAIEIRRYPNRRLYDRSRRRYVTLPEIEELVRAGRTVVIVDARNGEDLTPGILTQILVERHPERLLPVAMLHAMLRANELTLEVVRASWRQAAVALEALARPAAGPAPRPPASPLDWMAALGLAPSTAATAPRPADGPPPVADEAPPADASLSRRVAELEARLARLAAAEGAGAGAAPPPAKPARAKSRPPAPRKPTTRRRPPGSS